MRRSRSSTWWSALVVATSYLIVPTPVQADTITNPDPRSSGVVTVAMVLDPAGNPAAAYLHHDRRGPLALLRCDDPACEGTGEVVTEIDIGATAGERHRVVSVAIDDANRPVLVYGWSGAVWIISCDDPYCRDGGDVPRRIDDGRSPSMQFDPDGRPVIAYAGGTRGRNTLSVMHCNDPTCSGDDDVAEIVVTRFEISALSVDVDGDGHPVVAFAADVGGLDHVISVVRCNDPACAGGDETPNEPARAFAPVPSLRLDDQDRAGVVFYDEMGGGTTLLRCNDAACAGGDDATVSPFDRSAFPVGWAFGADGNPVLLYRDEADDELRLRRCADPECGPGSPDHLVQVGSIGGGSLQLDAADRPIGAYALLRDGPQPQDGVGILRCDDPDCDPDNDDDGVPDAQDAFPFDPDERLDTDGDGIGDNADGDDDGDGQLDGDERACGSDPLDGGSTSPDADGDGVPDCASAPVTAAPVTLPATGNGSARDVGLAAVLLLAGGLALAAASRRAPRTTRSAR